MLRRESWQEALFGHGLPAGEGAAAARDRIARLDDLLYECWRLGEQVVVLWTSEGRTISLLQFPHFALAEYVCGVRPIAEEIDAGAFIDALISGPKQASPAHFAAIAAKLGVEPVVRTLPFDPARDLDPALVDTLVRRYSVTLFHNRAVLLLDIVAFSTYTPIEQATLLNSLSYSINSAYDKLAACSVRERFARSPTGDGFYVWNRTADARANVMLYKLMLLLLADNAIARVRARTRVVPQLRCAFHVGAHYEFFQPEGLAPSAASYLVGQVTIDLARMLENAMPGQILIGDFAAASAVSDMASSMPAASDFVRRMQREVHDLAGLRMAGEIVREIRCYLTGPRRADDSFAISRYAVLDKHAVLRRMFNAKINIHRRDAAPIFLGIRDPDVRGFQVEHLGA
ncbi:MAG: hypothetical protein IT530_17570 [Burkholderiales bacterium]|nr:hypothetical protein [Burkholderiales bacterium]